MTRAGLGALWSHWRRHPVQLITLVVGLALATGLWTGVQAINAQARLSYDQAAATLGQNRLTRIEGNLTLADFAAARRVGWQVSPVLEVRLSQTSLRLFGIDPFTLPPTPGGVAPNLTEAEDLRGFLTGQIVFASPSTAARVPAEIAEVRVLKGLAPGLVMMDITAAQSLVSTDRVTRLLVAGTEAKPPQRLADQMEGAVVSPPEPDEDLARLTDSFHLNLTAFGLLAFVVGLFIVHATIGLAFEQRRGLFRTLRALGVPARRLAGLLALELASMTLLAGALGIVLGYLVAAQLLPGVAATLSGLYGAGVDGSLSLSPSWWLSGFAMAGGGMIVAGGLSLRQIMTLPVLAPAMPRAWMRAQASVIRWQGVAGLVLLTSSAGLAVSGDGLVVGFMTLGALLLGAALVLPPCLVLVLDAGARGANGPVAQWLWADARQQVPGLSLALMALLLALAANVGVGTMVGSFRSTFTGWLDQRLAAEIYITASSPEEADRVEAFLEDRAEAVLPIISAESDLLGATGEVFGILDHATYRNNWPLLSRADDVWGKLDAGEGVLVNEQLARREDLWTGSKLSLSGYGPVPVLGVYSDYGNPRGQAILGMSLFARIFPEAQRMRLAVRISPEQVPILAADLAERFDLSSEQVVEQARVKAFSLAVFDRTFAVTAALNALTLGVAGFALWASLTSLGATRLPQIAPVWALGLTRRTLALADVARALALALLTAALAVPVGVALAWILLAVVNVQAFGWRLPLLADPASWAVLAGWAVVAAIVAALLPAWRLWRLPAADLIKVFASER